MDRTVAHLRLEQFLRGLLSTEPDESRRLILERLLAPEQAILASCGERAGAVTLDVGSVFAGA